MAINICDLHTFMIGPKLSKHSSNFKHFELIEKNNLYFS